MKLLTYLGFDVLVARVETTETTLKSVDFVESEFSFPERFDAFHDVEQPSTCLQRLMSEEEGLLPLLQNRLFRANDAILNDVNLS